MVRDLCFGLALGWCVTACGAVYPELATPLHAVPQGAKLEPGPPTDVVYIEAGSAKIPDKTPDGRKWSAAGNGLPDPYVLVFAGDKEILRTPVQSDTLEPKWPDAVKANYRIARNTRVRYELWDSTAFTHHPICMGTIDDIQGQAEFGQVDIECESGTRATLVVKKAKAVLGLGLYYELRSEDVFVTRVFAESPASRVGLQGGFQIVAIMGQPTHGMDPDLVRSLININARSGVQLLIRKPDGSTETISVREGPIYPLVNENVDLASGSTL
jgi:hypothetical protein